MPLSFSLPLKSNLINLTTMYEYKCFTRQGSWRFYADSDTDALRLALFYCWRDGEDCSCQREQRSSLLEPMPSAAELGRRHFIKVQSDFGGQPYTLRLCKIDKTNSITTL